VILVLQLFEANVMRRYMGLEGALDEAVDSA